MDAFDKIVTLNKITVPSGIKYVFTFINPKVFTMTTIDSLLPVSSTYKPAGGFFDKQNYQNIYFFGKLTSVPGTLFSANFYQAFYLVY